MATPLFRHTYSHREVPDRHPLHALAHHLPKAPTTIGQMQPVHIVGMTPPLAHGGMPHHHEEKVETTKIPLVHIPMPKLPPHASVHGVATKMKHIGSVPLKCAFMSGKVPVAFIG